MDHNKDLYRILNVHPTCEQAEIKKSFHNLSRLYHPDKAPRHLADECRRRYEEIRFAYSVLGEEEHRREYNDLRHNSAEKTFLELKKQADKNDFGDLSSRKREHESIVEQRNRHLLAAFRERSKSEFETVPSVAPLACKKALKEPVKRRTCETALVVPAPVSASAMTKFKLQPSRITNIGEMYYSGDPETVVRGDFTLDVTREDVAEAKHVEALAPPLETMARRHRSLYPGNVGRS